MGIGIIITIALIIFTIYMVSDNEGYKYQENWINSFCNSIIDDAKRKSIDVFYAVYEHDDLYNTNSFKALVGHREFTAANDPNLPGIGYILNFIRENSDYEGEVIDRTDNLPITYVPYNGNYSWKKAIKIYKKHHSYFEYDSNNN